MDASQNEQTWLTAVVVPITGADPTSAWENFTERASELNALFVGSPLVASEEDIADPDFDVSVRSHGRTLGYADES